jgi:glycosyltransferase involved in cell wall biosynthesis
MNTNGPRVLMVTGAYFPELSGGVLQCKYIAETLREDAMFTVLTTCTDPDLQVESEVGGIAVFRVHVDVRHPLSKLKAVVRMAALFARLRNRFDVVALQGFSQKSLLIVLLARLFGKRVVMTIHTAGFDEPSAVRSMGRLAFWCYAQADLFMTVSPRLAQNYLAAGLPPERLWPVSYAVDLERFRPAVAGERSRLRQELGLADELTWILFVGFFSRDKAPDVLFDAWMTLLRDHPRTGLVFVGASRSSYFEVDEDIASEIRRRAGEAGAADRVVLVEPTPDVDKYYRAVDLFVMPSLREGLGMVLVEAMASELPVVASRLEGVTDTFLDHGRNGLLVPPGNVEALADALRRLLSNPELAHQLAIVARQTVAARFAVGAVAGRWLDGYQRALAGTASSPR